MRDAERDDIEPAEGLLDDRVEVNEGVRIRELWQAGRPDDRVQLSLRLLQDIGMEAQSEKDRLKRRDGLQSARA